MQATEPAGLSPPAPSTTRAQDGKVQCVKMACKGDTTYPPGPFSSVTLPADSPIFSSGELSAISSRVGQPMLLYRIPPSKALASQRINLDNIFATFMMLEADPRRSGFGWAPPKYQSHIGSVIVARQDFAPLTVVDLECMADFCQTYMQELFEEYLDSGSTDPSEVIAAMTPENYREQVEEHLEMQRQYREDNP